MFKKIMYSCILGMLISTLALGAEVRKFGVNDLSWGPYGTTWTSPAGKVVTYIPRYYDNNAYADNLTLYGNDLVAKGPVVDCRYAMDGVGGRPTRATWEADKVNTDVTLVAKKCFDDARSSGVAKHLYFDQGDWKITASVDGGGFGNQYLKVSGAGRYYQGTRFNCVMDNGVCLDFTGNENMMFGDFQVNGDATHTPNIGALLAATLVGPNVRGGNYQVINFQTSGNYNVAGMYLYGAEQCVLDRCTLGAAGSGVCIAISNYAVPTLPVSSAFYTLDTLTAGITTYTAQNTQYGLAGTGRADVFIEGVTSIYNEINPKFVNSASSPHQFIEAYGTDAINVLGARGESPNAQSFIKTNGFKNGFLRGFLSTTGPLIDLEATYGPAAHPGGGIILNSYIALGPGATGGYLMNKPNATDNAGLSGNIIQLMDSGVLVDNGSKQVSGNLIFNYNDPNDNNVILHAVNSSDDGNVIIGNAGFRFSDGISGKGASIKNVVGGSALWSPNIADNTSGNTTLTIAGASSLQTCITGFQVSGGVPAGVLLFASWTSGSTVTVTAFNKSGGTWNPGEGTLRVQCWKF